MSGPMWGPPIPSPAEPSKNQGFCLLQTKCAGAGVEGWVGGAGEVGEAEKAGDVGVVHEVAAAEAVDFVGPDGSVRGGE